MTGRIPIQSTAGAIPVRNEKGEFTMEKVKVSRYVSGKRPDYAPQESSDEDEEFEFGIKQKKMGLPIMKTLAERDDRRLKRLQERQIEEPEEDKAQDKAARRRALHEPEVLAEGSDEDEEEEPEKEVDRKDQEMEESSAEEEEELDEEEIERRRALLRQRAQQQTADEVDIMDLEEEKSEEGSEEESSEYEEYTDSEEEETGPRLKPVFVRKKDRVTIQEKEKEAERQKILEIEAKKMADERRRQTLKLVEEEARKELQELKGVQDACDKINSEDEDNDEEEYEAWKLRELKRIKRDKEERDTTEKDKLDIDRIHNMNEEERRNEMRLNPKVITNKATKGKYKFLQKYYHRGAFFMEQEDHVYKQDFSAPTLEDHFDKTILPKVMQVKNFGRSGRTKYTHLVDQDTTSFDSPWASDTTQNLKFHTAKGGGMKQHFDRPTTTKKRK